MAGELGGNLLLTSDVFRDHVAQLLVYRIRQLTGCPIEIRSLQIIPWSYTVVVQGVSMRSAGETRGAPLLNIDKLMVQPSIWTLLGRGIVLNEVFVDRPIVRISMDAQGEANTFPIVLEHGLGASGGFTVRHLKITDGEVNYKNGNTNLSAEVFKLNITGVNTGSEYKGRISYENGQLRVPKYESIRHGLTARFTTTPKDVSIELILTAGAATLAGHAEIERVNHWALDATYRLDLPIEEMSARPAGWSGSISGSGRVQYRRTPKGSFWLNLIVDGQLTSQIINASLAVSRLELRNVRAHYRLQDGTFKASDIEADLLGGEVTGDFGVQHLDSNPAYQLSASFHEISIKRLLEALRSSGSRSIPLDGTIHGTAKASWTGNVGNITAQCDLRSRGTIQVSSTDNAVPVDVAIRASYSRPKNAVAFQQIDVQTPFAIVAAHGEASADSNLQVRAATHDLSESFRTLSALTHRVPGSRETSGSATLEAAITGPIDNPNVVGHLTAERLIARDTHWNKVSIEFQANPSEVQFWNASATDKHRGSLFSRGRISLTNWSYSQINPLSIDLFAQKLDVFELQHLVRGSYDIDGDLSGELHLRGSGTSPAGSATLRLEDVHVYGETLPSVSLDCHSDRATFECMGHAGNLEPGNLSLSFTPSSRTFNLRVTAVPIALQRLRAIRRRNITVMGNMHISAFARGRLDSPELDVTFDLPDAQIRKLSIPPIVGKLWFVNQSLTLDLQSGVANAPVKVHGRVNLTGGQDCEATIDTGTMDITEVLKTVSPTLPDAFHVRTELHGVLKGPLEKFSALEGHITIPIIAADFAGLRVTNARPMQLDYSRSLLILQPAELRGSGAEFQTRGTIRITDQLPVDVSVKGSINTVVLNLIDANLNGSGKVLFTAQVAGSLRNPTIKTRMEVKELALSTSSDSIAIENLNGVVEAEDNRLRISTLYGQLNGGSLSLVGSVLYWPTLEFNVGVQAKGVRLPYGFLRMLLDGNFSLVGNANFSTLKGQVVVDNVGFTPDFDLKRTMEYFQQSTVRPASSWGASTKIAVAVRSRTRLNVTSPLASVEGEFNLQVIGTVANPVLVGRTDISTGELFYRSRRYQLERGVIVFDNPHKTRPALDASVTTTVQQYKLNLTFRGPLDRLSTLYSSDPPLATADIINLIAVGGTATSSTTRHGKDSILASQIMGQVSTKVQSLTGISGLRIDPLVGGSNRNPSARIAIQQRVTKNLLFTFSTDISQPGAETVEGKYQISPRWSVGVARNQVGGISVDGRYHTKF